MPDSVNNPNIGIPIEGCGVADNNFLNWIIKSRWSPDYGWCFGCCFKRVINYILSDIVLTSRSRPQCYVSIAGWFFFFFWNRTRTKSITVRPRPRYEEGRTPQDIFTFFAVNIQRQLFYFLKMLLTNLIELSYTYTPKELYNSYQTLVENPIR